MPFCIIVVYGMCFILLEFLVVTGGFVAKIVIWCIIFVIQKVNI
jgi:hypothetical protein